MTDDRCVTLAGWLTVALCGACAAPSPMPTTASTASSAPEAREVALAPTVVASAPGPPTAAAPAAKRPEVATAIAKIDLRIPASVVLGDPLPIELANVDDHDHAFWLAGAAGCAGPFEVSFTTGTATYREDLSMSGCGASVVPPRWLVIAKGSSAKFEVATDVPVVAEGAGAELGTLGIAGRTLPPGAYTLKVTGAGVSVAGPIVLLATKNP